MAFVSRPAFDPVQPFQASAVIQTKGRRFEVGARFPWRELGIDEALLWSMWHAGQVDVMPQPKPTPASQQPPARNQQNRR